MIPYNPNRLFMPLPDQGTQPASFQQAPPPWMSDAEHHAEFLRTLREQRPSYGTADPRMTVQPYADPGNAMPNADMGNLNQSPGLVVPGTLPASAQQPQQGWTFDPAQAQAALDAMKRT